jgi:hypothetical protein
MFEIDDVQPRLVDNIHIFHIIMYNWNPNIVYDIDVVFLLWAHKYIWIGTALSYYIINQIYLKL